MRHTQQLRQFVDILLRSTSLTVEECRDGDFVAAEFGGDGLEAQLLLCLGLEHGGHRLRQPVLEGRLAKLISYNQWSATTSG